MASRNFLLGAVAVLCLQITTAKDIECGSTPKPDFKAPGRRISEEKCLEYNWERNNIEKCSKDPAHTDYPYVGMIGYTKENTTDLSFKCGAFLISPKFAMTAGNCVVQTRQLTPEIVRFGNRNIDTGVPRSDVKIKRIISNPEYKPSKRDNDIALLELEEELPMTKSVQPICLWHSSLDGVKDVLNPGWGQGNSHGVFRETLRVMKVALIDHEKCEALVKNHFNRRWTKLQEYQICVDESKSDDPLCLGSSGTPLVTADKQAETEDQIPYAVGVNSFGFACSQGLGFYTKVSSFMDWIEPVVWPSS